MWLLLVLLGCPAEMLGIPVPKEGADAIAMDDLVRDVSKLSRGEAASDSPSGEAARRAFLAERWAQMGLEVREGGRCGYRAGTGDEAVALIAEPGPAGQAPGAAPAAVAISVAKALHGRDPDPRAVWFCVGDPPVEPVRSWRLGALGQAEAVRAEEGTVVRIAQPPGASGDLDYRALQALATELYGEVWRSLGSS